VDKEKLEDTKRVKKILNRRIADNEMTKTKWKEDQTN
jgi:hypothetical protein